MTTTSPPRPWGVFKQSGTLLVGNAFYRSEMLFDRYFASNELGGLASFHVAARVVNGANTVLAKSLVAPVFPVLARLAARGDRPGLDQVVGRRTAILGGAWVSLVLVGVATTPVVAWIGPLGDLSGEEVRRIHVLGLLLLGVLSSNLGR